MLAAKDAQFKYDELLESALSRIGSLLNSHYIVSKRTISGCFCFKETPR